MISCVTLGIFNRGCAAPFNFSYEKVDEAGLFSTDAEYEVGVQTEYLLLAQYGKSTSRHLLVAEWTTSWLHPIVQSRLCWLSASWQAIPSACSSWRLRLTP